MERESDLGETERPGRERRVDLREIPERDLGERERPGIKGETRLGEIWDREADPRRDTRKDKEGRGKNLGQRERKT